MLKHIMEIVKGNTEFIKADQTPPYLACLIECLGPLFCTLLVKLGP